jgi:hypothetical protein
MNYIKHNGWEVSNSKFFKEYCKYSSFKDAEIKFLIKKNSNSWKIECHRIQSGTNDYVLENIIKPFKNYKDAMSFIDEEIDSLLIGTESF